MASAVVGALLLGSVAARPVSAYANPGEVPIPFQHYGACDYADAIWNLETEPEQTFVHFEDEGRWWCTGDEADKLREQFEERDVDHLREMLWGCLDDERRDELQWGSLPPY